MLRSPGGVVGTVEAGYTYPDASAGMTRSGDNEVRVGASGAYLIARDADVWRVTAAGEEVLPGARGGRPLPGLGLRQPGPLAGRAAPAGRGARTACAVQVLDGAYAAAAGVRGGAGRGPER